MAEIKEFGFRKPTDFLLEPFAILSYGISVLVCLRCFAFSIKFWAFVGLIDGLNILSTF